MLDVLVANHLWTHAGPRTDRQCTEEVTGEFGVLSVRVTMASIARSDALQAVSNVSIPQTRCRWVPNAACTPEILDNL